MVGDNSLFRLVSVGVVAENKLRTTNEVEVLLNELNPFLHGELKSDTVEDIAEGVDRQGNSFSVMAKMSNTIKAKWKGDGTNRTSAPDVRRGERVEVWQFSNADQYYWSVLREPGSNVRRLETVVTTFNNSQDESQTESTKNNSWYNEVSTHDGHMTIKTNKSNGEPFAYTIQLNAKEGNFVIADDAGLYIQANSAERHIEFDNGGGTYLSLNKKKTILNTGSLEVSAPDGITFNASKFNMVVDNITSTGSNFKINSNVDIAGSTFKHNGVNVGSTHFHIGNLGNPTSTPQG